MLFRSFLTSLSFLWYILGNKCCATNVARKESYATKVKFSKEAIIGTALQLVREEGMASLTARALAEKLGATPRVIFGQF